jgi:hypothetical protein
MRDEAGNTYVEQVGPVSAGSGEPWLTFLTPDSMSALLVAHGLAPAAHLYQRGAVDDALWHRGDALRPGTLSVLTRAVVAGTVTATTVPEPGVDG